MIHPHKGRWAVTIADAMQVRCMLGNIVCTMGFTLSDQGISLELIILKYQGIMMTSSNGNILCVTGHLWGESTGHRWIPLTKASDTELWCFLWSAPERTGWANHRDASDLRHHCAHYDITVMIRNGFLWSALEQMVEQTIEMRHHCAHYIVTVMIWNGNIINSCLKKNPPKPNQGIWKVSTLDFIIDNCFKVISSCLKKIIRSLISPNGNHCVCHLHSSYSWALGMPKGWRLLQLHKLHLSVEESSHVISGYFSIHHSN